MKRLAVLLVAVLATACSAPYSQSSVPFASRDVTAIHRGSTYPITHVVVIMQENRSFDNMFHGFPHADSAMFGYGHGVKYPLQELPLKWKFDPNHYHYQFLEDYDGGKNDGWDQLIRDETPSCPYGNGWVNHPSCWEMWAGKVYQRMAFSYTRKSDIQPYWTMAARYTLGDHNFSSTSGPSFGPHQILIAGQDGHADEVPNKRPWGCDATEKEYYLHFGLANPPEFPPAFGHDELGRKPCFKYATVANLLDNANVSWRWYVQPQYEDSFWLSAFDAIRPIRYGSDWSKIVTPDARVLTDIAKGNLSEVSWVMPHGGASDHAGGGSGDCGPAWVTSIVNAIGQSQYWKSTAIIILWDEWGGWFDHVVPPQYPDPVTGAYEGLGYRVPLIIVSPYAKNHYVSTSQHETASTLAFIEKMFVGGTKLPGGLADSRADAYDDVFEFAKPPTAFTAIPKPPNYKYCMAQRDTPAEEDY